MCARASSVSAAPLLWSRTTSCAPMALRSPREARSVCGAVTPTVPARRSKASRSPRRSRGCSARSSFAPLGERALDHCGGGTEPVLRLILQQRRQIGLHGRLVNLEVGKRLGHRRRAACGRANQVAQGEPLTLPLPEAALVLWC